MNSENSKTSDFYKLVIGLTNKMDVIRGNKCVSLSDVSIYYTWKI